MQKDTKMDSGKMEAEQGKTGEARRSREWGSNWLVGVVFILIGGLFLLQNFTGFELNNRWALFILIPVVGAFSNAHRAYQAAGNRLNASARGSLISGLEMTLVGVILLFNLDWSLLWPVGLVVVGVGMLLSSLAR